MSAWKREGGEREGEKERETEREGHTKNTRSSFPHSYPAGPLLTLAAPRSPLLSPTRYDYARHFVSACTRILGLEHGRLQVVE